MNEQIILYILQVTIVYNALTLGWNVKKINGKRYELTKKFADIDNVDIDKFLDTLLVIRQ